MTTEIIIKGDAQNPLFRASDIGNILDISTIRSVIRDFNETENEYVIEIELPRLKKEEIKIEVQKSVISVSAKNSKINL